MPKVPQDQKRPAEVIGAAICVARIATGEEAEDQPATGAAAKLGREGGKKRAANMTPERRSENAKKAAAKRWGCRTFD